ncbi:MAG: UDP-N-acetylmuramate--L-alanine ligase [Deltaproteobacteria bacterium]|nr:UDP-N-acetylmuramate--L-alanine ligase [Deltaproteobacteria bacterium]
MRRKVQCIHFVGIGGIGMSGIAEVLLNLGYAVSGSDLGQSDITQRLSALGAKIAVGHDAGNLREVDVVVTSTAVRADNPEVVEAHRRMIPVIPRAEMLAELLKMKFSIAVSGSHGKTTTTSMVATVLADGGLDPTMVIGGKLGSIGSNAKMGGGSVIVAEADESDGSFLKLSPSIAVITNIDREHLDYYRDIDDIKSAFLQFANIVPFYGSTIICADDAHCREIIPLVKRKVITYGLSQPADYQAADMTFAGSSSRFSVRHGGALLGEVVLNVPGIFNISNALAAVAVARELDMAFAVICDGLSKFGGVQRRLEVKGKTGGVTVVDDYGHHPTEIKATLAAARHVWHDRVICVFQPHRYTRTKALYQEFLSAFADADVLILTDIYPASEEPIPGVDSLNLCRGITEAGHKDATYMADAREIVEKLRAIAKPSDCIITLGAGNVWKIGEEYLRKVGE